MNIRYDASVYKVVVTVDENMTATVAYYKDGNLVNSDTGAAFSNTSIVREVKASLQGNKTLNGQPSTASYKYQVVEVADEKGTVKDNAQSWEVTNNTTEISHTAKDAKKKQKPQQLNFQNLLTMPQAIITIKLQR